MSIDFDELVRLRNRELELLKQNKDYQHAILKKNAEINDQRRKLNELAHGYGSLEELAHGYGGLEERLKEETAMAKEVIAAGIEDRLLIKALQEKITSMRLSFANRVEDSARQTSGAVILEYQKTIATLNHKWKSAQNACRKLNLRLKEIEKNLAWSPRESGPFKTTDDALKHEMKVSSELMVRLHNIKEELYCEREISRRLEKKIAQLEASALNDERMLREQAAQLKQPKIDVSIDPDYIALTESYKKAKARIMELQTQLSDQKTTIMKVLEIDDSTKETFEFEVPEDEAEEWPEKLSYGAPIPPFKTSEKTVVKCEKGHKSYVEETGCVICSGKFGV